MGIFAAALLVAATASATASPTFEAWAATYNRSYPTAAEAARRSATFHANAALVEAHNTAADAGAHTFRLALNQFADMSRSEWAALVAPMKLAVAAPTNDSAATVGLRAPPPSVDWQAAGAVGPVENQGQLASVYAFVFANVVASWAQIATKKLYAALSSTQLAECTQDYASAQPYILQHGICAAGAYKSSPGGGCGEASCAPAAQPKQWVGVTANSMLALQNAIAVGPVAVGVEADQSIFQFYSTGVITGACGSNIDHQLLATGYASGEAGGLDYYRAQNTWGTSWGEAGYVRIGMGAAYPASGECAIQTWSLYPA